MVAGGAGLAAVRTYLRHLVFGIPADDPVTLACAAALILAAAVVAAYVPARRATRVDPIVALRTE